MRIKKALGSLTVAVALTAGTFGAMGAAAPSAEAGLVCTASINGKTVTSVCKSFSGNSYKYVRAIASCRDGSKVYGPWVNGNTGRSKATCASGNAHAGDVQLRR